jgi:3-oxoadipate enol-lactonase
MHVSPELDMHYLVDDYTDPWCASEAVLLIHGNNESGFAWYGWVPHLARHYRVIRPDMRGFGESTPMPRHHPWNLDEVVNDYATLLDGLGVSRVHLVGAKIGGVIARVFAARRPELIHTLTVVGSPPPVRLDLATVAERVREVEQDGIEAWARRSTAARLGKDFPADGVEWWVKYMARTSVPSEAGFAGTINFSDITADIPKIRCPMLVITTEGSGLGSVSQMESWVRQVKHSELKVLPGDSFHVAATAPDACAEATREFISRHRIL